MTVISLFEFANSFERKNANAMNKEELKIYLGAWKFIFKACPNTKYK